MGDDTRCTGKSGVKSLMAAKAERELGVDTRQAFFDIRRPRNQARKAVSLQVLATRTKEDGWICRSLQQVHGRSIPNLRRHRGGWSRPVSTGIISSDDEGLHTVVTCMCPCRLVLGCGKARHSTRQKCHYRGIMCANVGTVVGAAASLLSSADSPWASGTEYS